jgi:hypothetical protein
MKYLNLNEEELSNIKALIRRKHLISFLIIFIIISILSFISGLILKPFHLFGRASGSGIIFIFSALLCLLVAIIIAGRHKYVVWKETSERKKKVFTGVISEKRIKEKNGKVKYYLYMEGRKFKVSYNDYCSFNTGDPAEFHVCLNQKLLLKVTKPD